MAQGLKAASKKAAQQAQLDALDALGTDRSSFDSALSVIENVALDFVERVKDNIQQSKMIVTGDIDNISISTDGDTVNVFGTPHLIFQDKGVNGSVNKLYNTPFSYKTKRPPMESFLQWVKTRNLQNRNADKFFKEGSPFKNVTEEDKQKSLAYAIREKVFRDGFKPRNVYTKEIPGLISDLQDQIPNFAAEQVVQQLRGMPPINVTLNL